MIFRPSYALVLAALAASPAAAQTSRDPLAPNVSGSGLGTGAVPPGVRTGSITGAGQTKPPGAPGGRDRGISAELERKNEEIDRQIGKGICRGCD